ncbi:MAG: hypothetical protein ACOC71_02650 [Hyphomicrobiales bacterium]
MKDDRTAETVLFTDRALRGMIGVRREQDPDGSRYLVFTKRRGQGQQDVRRFRLDGDTLTEVGDE